MPRKKSGKRVIKRKEINTLATIQKMEKEFLKTPTMLAVLLNKEINLLKQKESKLKKSINQLITHITNFEKRSLSNAKSSAAHGKKRVYSANVKAKALFTKQLNSIEQLLKTTTDKYAKLIAFSKYINQFEKEWSKQSSKIVPIKKLKQPTQTLEAVQAAESEANDALINNVAEAAS